MSEPAPPTVGWGLGDVVVGLVVALVSWMLVGSVVLSLGGWQDADEVPFAVVTILQAALWVGYLGVPVYAARAKGHGLRRDFGFWQDPSDVAVGLASGVGAQVAVWLLYWPLVVWFESLDPGEAARETVDRATGFGVVILVLVVVVGAPIIEELFFRGLFYRSLQNRWGAGWAVVGSAVVFAGLHFQPLQFPGLLLFGLVAAWWVRRRDRLGPAIWAHIGFNGTTVALLLAGR